jgi:hypothetical protein
VQRRSGELLVIFSLRSVGQITVEKSREISIKMEIIATMSAGSVVGTGNSVISDQTSVYRQLSDRVPQHHLRAREFTVFDSLIESYSSYERRKRTILIGFWSESVRHLNASECRKFCPNQNPPSPPLRKGVKETASNSLFNKGGLVAISQLAYEPNPDIFRNSCKPVKVELRKKASSE